MLQAIQEDNDQITCRKKIQSKNIGSRFQILLKEYGGGSIMQTCMETSGLYA